MQDFILTYRTYDLTPSYGFSRFDQQEQHSVYNTRAFKANSYEDAYEQATRFLDEEARYDGICKWVSLEHARTRRFTREQLLGFISRIDSLERAEQARDFIVKLRDIPRTEKRELLIGIDVKRDCLR